MVPVNATDVNMHNFTDPIINMNISEVSIPTVNIIPVLTIDARLEVNASVASVTNNKTSPATATPNTSFKVSLNM